MGAQNVDRSSFIANHLCRLCISLAALVALPLFVEMPFILKMWLKNPPAGSVAFCQIMLFIIWFSSTSGGVSQVINGSGKIKWFKINTSIFFVLCIPVGYVAFKAGMPAYMILVFFAVSDICQRIIQNFFLSSPEIQRIVKFLLW